MTEDQDQVRHAWDKIAPGYAKTRDAYIVTWVKNESLHRAGLRPGMRFLDVAAGSGALSIPAARRGAQVLATDLSPVMLDLLRTRASDEGHTIETRAMNWHSLVLEDNSFDMNRRNRRALTRVPTSPGTSSRNSMAAPRVRVL